MFWHNGPLLEVITHQSLAGTRVRTVSGLSEQLLSRKTFFLTVIRIKKTVGKPHRGYSNKKKGKKLFFHPFTKIVHHLRGPILKTIHKEGGDTDTGSNTYTPCDWDKEGVDDGQIDEQL